DDRRQDEAVAEREQEVGRPEELRVAGQGETRLALEARQEHARDGQNDEDPEPAREDEPDDGGEAGVGERAPAPPPAPPSRPAAALSVVSGNGSPTACAPCGRTSPSRC